MYRISPIAKPELTCVEMNDVARWARLLRQRSGFKSDISRNAAGSQCNTVNKISK